jgi:xylan 1,4-beta-xylosidase
MYDYAADGLLKALPTAKIGGCNITGGGQNFYLHLSITV